MKKTSSNQYPPQYCGGLVLDERVMFMSEHIMTEREKEHRLAQIRTGLAFGGGELTEETKKNLEDIWSGKCTHEEVLDRICSKYTRSDG